MLATSDYSSSNWNGHHNHNNNNNNSNNNNISHDLDASDVPSYETLCTELNEARVELENQSNKIRELQSLCERERQVFEEEKASLQSALEDEREMRIYREDQASVGEEQLELQHEMNERLQYKVVQLEATLAELRENHAGFNDVTTAAATGSAVVQPSTPPTPATWAIENHNHDEHEREPEVLQQQLDSPPPMDTEFPNELEMEHVNHSSTVGVVQSGHNVSHQHSPAALSPSQVQEYYPGVDVYGDSSTAHGGGNISHGETDTSLSDVITAAAATGGPSDNNNNNNNQRWVIDIIFRLRSIQVIIIDIY
jgi:hypothetical protein